MKTAAAFMLCLLAVSMPAASQEPLTHEQRITRLTETLSYIREHDVASKVEADESYRDLRGRIAFDDFKQWVFTPELVEKLTKLLEKVRDPDPAVAHDALNQGDLLMYAAVAKGYEVEEYWTAIPQISWRDRWKAFANANGLQADAPDPALWSEEKALMEALSTGRFAVAAALTKRLDEQLVELIRRSTGEVLKSKKPEDIVFVPRTTPCPLNDKSAGSASARLIQAGDPDAWFPDGSRDRGEHGAIVLRARISADSCAMAFAVMVSSGYPELDAAAVKVAEASRYKAAVESGKPVADELTFKVRFDLKEEPQP